MTQLFLNLAPEFLACNSSPARRIIWTDINQNIKLFMTVRIVNRVLWLIALSIALCVCCSSWSEDMAILAVVFILSLSAIATYSRFNRSTATVNLMIWIGYNALLGYCLFYKSDYGTSLMWLCYMIWLNIFQTIILSCIIIAKLIKQHFRRWFHPMSDFSHAPKHKALIARALHSAVSD